MSHSGEFNNGDSPYTVFEGEALLRYPDADITNLPSRPLYPSTAGGAGNILAGTQGVIGADHARREMLRVRGSSLPVPMVTAQRERRTQVIGTGVGAPMGSMTVLDLYRERLTMPMGTTAQQYDAALRKIVPWEFLHGQSSISIAGSATGSIPTVMARRMTPPKRPPSTPGKRPPALRASPLSTRMAPM
jgi:hypothetical protein